MVRPESRPSTIGHITLGTKQTGAPSAGNPHAGCDVAGAGDGFTVWLMRHSQRKRGAMARLDLRNTAPVLDPTGKAPVIRNGIGDNPLERRTSTSSMSAKDCYHQPSIVCNAIEDAGRLIVKHP